MNKGLKRKNKCTKNSLCMNVLTYNSTNHKIYCDTSHELSTIKPYI